MSNHQQDDSFYQQVVHKFEEEKQRIDSCNNNHLYKMIELNKETDIETFHFMSIEEAELATKLIFEFCKEYGYTYGHVCCGGKGHCVTKPKEKISDEIVITI